MLCRQKKSSQNTCEVVTLFAYDFKLITATFADKDFGVAISPKETQFADGPLDLFISFYLFIII
jgi:hypothetical protein